MRFLTLLLLLLMTLRSEAQVDTIRLDNPSFEDYPRAGGSEVRGIRGWYDCGIINFPDETPPDIHPKNFWSNTKQAHHGKTYLGMVVRDNDSWESVAQRLSAPMSAGECYSFSMMLSKSERYLSGSRKELEENGDRSSDYNYTTPIVVRVWGGSGYCNTKELLAETIPVKHSEWKEYSFKLSPSFSHKYIVIEAFYVTPVLVLPNGHVLIDDLSDIVRIDCSDEVLAQVEEPKKNIPPHKRIKKRPTEKPSKDTTPKTEENTVDAAPKEKVMKLDRSTMKKGQTIEIKNLYFKADVATINNASYSVLDEVYEFLRDNEDITVEIGGHTNGTPSHEYCDKLSTERAKEVAVYLVEKGIDGDRIYYKGYGKRKSIASNLTKEGRKKNQRVEIKILSIG